MEDRHRPHCREASAPEETLHLHGQIRVPPQKRLAECVPLNARLEALKSRRKLTMAAGHQQMMPCSSCHQLRLPPHPCPTSHLARGLLPLGLGLGAVGGRGGHLSHTLLHLLQALKDGHPELIIWGGGRRLVRSSPAPPWPAQVNGGGAGQEAAGHPVKLILTWGD